MARSSGDKVDVRGSVNDSEDGVNGGKIFSGKHPSNEDEDLRNTIPMTENDESALMGTIERQYERQDIFKMNGVRYFKPKLLNSITDSEAHDLSVYFKRVGSGENRADISEASIMHKNTLEQK